MLPVTFNRYLEGISFLECIFLINDFNNSILQSFILEILMLDIIN
jgi:hypothetical protein